MGTIGAAVRALPSGRLMQVYPFHISMEGLEKAILCRDEEDYDVLIKCLFICSRRKDIIIVAYGVVSNHGHQVVLAADYASAKAFGEEVKRIYAMWFNHKYQESGVLLNSDVDVQCLDSDWYLKNAIAYDILNALDNGAKNISDYEWTSFRCMFRGGLCPPGCRDVSSLTQRERKRIFRTNDDISGTGWMINSCGHLEPASCCDWKYAEDVFDNDQSRFLRALGTVNIAEMQQKLIDGPRTRQADSEFYKTVDEHCLRWFKKGISSISLAQKTRILPYIYHTTRTSISQLARTFGLEREKVAEILHVKYVPRGKENKKQH